MALTQITEKGIKDGELVNADVNASAAIAKSKLASLDIVNADVNASAAIATSKIAGLATSATTDTTNAANIGSGTLPAARIGDDSIVEAKLDIHADPSGTDKFLAYTSNGMEWAVPSGGVSLANDANNRVITGTGSGLNGEANLTYDGNHLTQTIDSTAQGIKITTAGNVYPAVSCDANRTTEGQSVAWFEGKWNGNSIGGISIDCGDDTTNKDDGKISFYTTVGGTQTKKMTIEQDGNVHIEDGNLVIGTAGHGIDFSINSDLNAGQSSELLHMYEEGTFTPTANVGSFTNNTSTYTVIGRLVAFQIRGTFGSSTSGTAQNLTLPIAMKSGAYGACAINSNTGAGAHPVGQLHSTPKVMFKDTSGNNFNGGDMSGKSVNISGVYMTD